VTAADPESYLKTFPCRAISIKPHFLQHYLLLYLVYVQPRENSLVKHAMNMRGDPKKKEGWFSVPLFL
jgi:hypothetical protein